MMDIEVSIMDPIEPKTDLEAPDVPDVEPEKDVYVPRPKWQVAMAWIGIVIMVISILLYYYYIGTKY